MTVRGPDGGLRGMIRAKLAPLGQWVSVETGGTEQGVADLNVIVRATGTECWIECKKTSGLMVSFRPAQVGWLYTRWRLGGNVLIATRRVTEWKSKPNVDMLYVTSAQWVRELATRGLEATPHLIQTDGPLFWPWDAFAACIASREQANPPLTP